jgi:2-oxoglutarate dehydrogenase E1 component
LLGAAEKVTRVILSSGKVYYDLLKHRDSNKLSDVALVRVEQIYPLHGEKLQAILKKFRKAKTFVWCQEESENMGAWSHLRYPLEKLTGHALKYAGRDASASPAVGALSLHKIEQKKLIEEAFSCA